jgi:hypothetical protein
MVSGLGQFLGGGRAGLEKELGVRLFDRANRRLTPTPPSPLRGQQSKEKPVSSGSALIQLHFISICPSAWHGCGSAFLA